MLGLSILSVKIHANIILYVIYLIEKIITLNQF